MRSSGNKSIWNNIPLPVLIGGWLLAVIIGVVLIFTSFVDKPENAVPQAVAQRTPLAGKTNTPQPAQNTTPAPAQNTPGPAQPGDTPAGQTTPQFVKAKIGPDGLYPALPFGFGVQINGLIDDPGATATMVDRYDARWIKQQLQWGVFENQQGKMDWTGFDAIVNAAHAKGIRVMLSIVTAPQWTHPNLPPSTPVPGKGGENDPTAIKGPPDDPAAYANFIGQVLDRYQGKIQAIEVWNEQNLVREWRTSPQTLSAKRYVELLSAAYKVIKQRDPSITVISGALSPTGPGDGVNSTDDFVYMQQLIDAGLLDVVDCVGAHHNGYNVGPDVGADTAPNDPKAATAKFKGPFDNSKGAPDHSWFFKDTLQGYNRMLGGKKQLCVTEFGWASSEGYSSFPPNFEFAQDNTVQQQGDYIVQAYQLMQQWGFVKMAFLWNLDYGNKGKGPTDDPVPYSLIAIGGGRRASFDIVHAYLKQAANPQ